jgi:hypothetical protein
MSRLHNDEMSLSNDRSKLFLLGMYVGLLLFLIIVTLFDKNFDSSLRYATNIYGLLALAGAALGFWRVWKRADNPRAILALPSAWICFGLAGWGIAQGLYILGVWINGKDQYPWLSDVLYIASEVCWLVALLQLFKLLGRRALTEISPFMGIMGTVSALLIASYIWIQHNLPLSPLNPAPQEKIENPLLIIVTDFTYVLVTYSSMILAIALVLGKNTEIPRPVHQCIRYLFYATAIDAVATLAYTVTTKLEEGNQLVYVNGNWVDWLFLTAMYCWGVSGLKCPIRQEELHYVFGTTLSTMREEDIYRASEIAKDYARPADDTDQIIVSDSTRWILDKIPRCWRVVKLGEVVVGSTFLFPVPQRLINRFFAGEMTEREMFEEAKRNDLAWDCLYLADASILANHRRRGLAFNCFRTTIENIATEHNNLQIKVNCWTTTLESKRLAEKLRRHFESKGISVIIKD